MNKNMILKQIIIICKESLTENDRIMRLLANMNIYEPHIFDNFDIGLVPHDLCTRIGENNGIMQTLTDTGFLKNKSPAFPGHLTIPIFDTGKVAQF